MALYRKRPVTVEARQWLPGRTYARRQVIDWLEGLNWLFRYEPDGTLGVRTLESGDGYHRVDPYDWLIKGVRDEVYPVKPDIFEATYEPVNGE